MLKIEDSIYKRLIGEWKTTGEIVLGNNKKILTGKDSYEFILGKNFILHRADVLIGEERSETYEIISMEADTGKIKMQ